VALLFLLRVAPPLTPKTPTSNNAVELLGLKFEGFFVVGMADFHALEAEIVWVCVPCFAVLLRSVLEMKHLVVNDEIQVPKRNSLVVHHGVHFDEALVEDALSLSDCPCSVILSKWKGAPSNPATDVASEVLQVDFVEPLEKVGIAFFWFAWLTHRRLPQEGDKPRGPCF
jgi:hypothetical protein